MRRSNAAREVAFINRKVCDYAFGSLIEAWEAVHLPDVMDDAISALSRSFFTMPPI